MLAFAALVLLLVGLRLGKFGLGEQPRLSKMRWLQEWLRLLWLGSWEWKAQSHINVLEAAATLRLFRRVARDGGDLRVTYLADSHVSRSIVAKGRSASRALQQMLKASAAICIAFGILPAGRFAPTRPNPADHPTRDSEIPPAS